MNIGSCFSAFNDMNHKSNEWKMFNFRSRELSDLATGSGDMVRAQHFNEVFEGFAPETAGRNVWFLR